MFALPTYKDRQRAHDDACRDACAGFDTARLTPGLLAEMRVSLADALSRVDLLTRRVTELTGIKLGVPHEIAKARATLAKLTETDQ